MSRRWCSPLTIAVLLTLPSCALPSGQAFTYPRATRLPGAGAAPPGQRACSPSVLPAPPPDTREEQIDPGGAGAWSEPPAPPAGTPVRRAGQPEGGNEPEREGGPEEGGAQHHDGDQRLDTDRPHFPEASTAVGKGRFLLEGGYTFTRTRTPGARGLAHSYPEALLRIGLFADWFEFRLGQNFASQTTPRQRRLTSGAADLYLGVKVALTSQHRFQPQSALILQMTVPTGNRALTAGEALPGANYDFGWAIPKTRFALEGVLSANRMRDEAGHAFLRLAQGVTGLYHLTPVLESFLEWFAFYPVGAVGPNTAAQHYVSGGLVYYLSNDVLLDLRVGGGLNVRADAFFTGAGFGIRY